MILVTGATGLVGSHLLIALLENNEKVRAIYRTATALEKTKSLFHNYNKTALFDTVEWMQADITDVPSLESVFPNIESVYHCAALISFDPSDEKTLRKTNIEGTANVVNFCLAYQVKKLCYVSSIAALGDLKASEMMVTEETEWNPEIAHSDYAISKYGAEMEVWRGQQEGLSVTVVNPGVILGPGFWDIGSGLLFKQIAKGLPFYTKGISGFVSVTDVVKSMIRSMESENSGNRFIVVAENISYETVVKTIAVALKVKAPNFYIKPWMTEIFWRIDSVLAFLFGKKRKLSQATAQSIHQTDLYSNEKIKSELQFQFEDVTTYILEIGKYFPQKK
jgi:nucleoside-diphosphate-sugar epimerase